MDETPTEHVDGRARLFEREIADKRFVLALLVRLHVEKAHLPDDRPELADPPPWRAADARLRNELIRQFDIDLA